MLTSNKEDICAGYGQEDSYTHQAYKKWIIDARVTQSTYLDYLSFENTIKAVLTGKAKNAIFPMHNSIIGPIEATHCFKETIDNSFSEIGEVTLPIKHALIGCEGASLETIQTVISFPVALAQCRRAIERLGFQTREHHETAGAVRDVIQTKDVTIAAIGPMAAAAGGVVLFNNCADDDANHTIFKIYSLKSFA